MKRMSSVTISWVVAIGALSLALGLAAVAWGQPDPAIGTWKLNVAKAKYDPGPVPKSNTVTITAAGQGIKVSAKGVDAEGKPTTIEYTAAYDGKESPVTGAPAYDTVSAKRIDSRTTEFTRKKAGKLVQTARRTISADGKTMTVTSTGTDEQGRKINNVAVFDKQ